MSLDILTELARVKAHFQLRTVAMHMGVDPNSITQFVPISASPLDRTSAGSGPTEDRREVSNSGEPTTGSIGVVSLPQGHADALPAHPKASQDSLDNIIDVNGFHGAKI